MKKIICVIICIVIILLIIIIGKNYFKNIISIDSKESFVNNTNDVNTEVEKNTELLNIRESGEMNTRGLFDLGNGTDYSIDLMANDMTWNSENSLYHKVITNIEEYSKYKTRISLPELTNIDFETYFVVIVSNENVREDDEKDLFIYNVYADENTTNIIMKQKENPNLILGDEEQNNVFYAIVDKTQLRDTAKVIIDK